MYGLPAPWPAEKTISLALLTQWRRDVEGLLVACQTLPSNVLVTCYSEAAPPPQVEVPANIAVKQLERGGYCIGRNAALNDADDQGCAYLVFIDDDEVPCAGWLQWLVCTAEKTAHEVVISPVYAMPSPPTLFARSESLRPYRPTSPGPYEGHVGAGNTLLQMDFVRHHDLRFDMAYNEIGGEDTEFFRRARSLGARVYYQPRGWAMETVDQDRLTLRGRAVTGLAMGRRFVRLKPHLAEQPAQRVISLAANAAKFVRGAALADRGAMGDAAFGAGRAAGMLPAAWLDKVSTASRAVTRRMGTEPAPSPDTPGRRAPLAQSPDASEESR